MECVALRCTAHARFSGAWSKETILAVNGEDAISHISHLNLFRVPKWLLLVRHWQNIAPVNVWQKVARFGNDYGLTLIERNGIHTCECNAYAKTDFR